VLPEPVKGKDITPPGSAKKKWDCSVSNRQVVLDNVPAGYAPYLHSFDEADLKAKPKSGFEVLISVVADVHLHNDKDGSVDDNVDLSETGPITLWMSYNADDILTVQKSGYSVKDLVPVKIVPGANEWKKFPKKDVSDFIPCGEYAGVNITIASWGDPPSGWGVPP
jgi:hypothetical protein